VESADLITGGQAGYSGVCPFTIDRPIMRQRWERLTFLHWAYEPAVVQRVLPEGLHVDTFGGAAWVGLVPFFMRVWTPGGPGVPWVSNFCETNVRTYVRDPEDRVGIWFLSLDAARLGAVAVARSSYRLPYFWSSMSLTRQGMQVSYHCRRRLPGPRGATSDVRVSIGAPYDAAELSDRDHFLTARWVLFSVATSQHGTSHRGSSHRGGTHHVAGQNGATRQRFARAAHQPWPLYRAQARYVNDGLVAAAGLPAAECEPLVHYSPGVDVRIGRPESYH
jgi:uncharacterized protein YqjF (DUF2071 family)